MEIDSDQDVAPAGFGPGKTLRQARLDLKLTPEEVGQLLHLAPRQITALEDDDYEHLPQPTYVRGYLRNYALLLGLAPEPVLEAYARMQTQARPSAVLARTEPTSRDGQVRFATYVIAAIVIGFLIAWWRGYETGFREPAREQTIENNIERSTPLTEPGPEQRDSSLSLPPPATAPVAPTAATPAASPAGSAGPADRLGPAAPAAAPAVEPASVTLRAEQESWAEVRDAADRRLVYQLLAPGRVVRVAGKPPFSVFLGNVEGVTVEFNGQVYDATRHRRGEVARFTLGASRGAQHVAQ